MSIAMCGICYSIADIQGHLGQLASLRINCILPFREKICVLFTFVVNPA